MVPVNQLKADLSPAMTLDMPQLVCGPIPVNHIQLPVSANSTIIKIFPRMVLCFSFHCHYLMPCVRLTQFCMRAHQTHSKPSIINNFPYSCLQSIGQRAKIIFYIYYIYIYNMSNTNMYASVMRYMICADHIRLPSQTTIITSLSK